MGNFKKLFNIIYTLALQNILSITSSLFDILNRLFRFVFHCWHNQPKCLSFLICDTIHVSRFFLHILLLLITSPVVFLSIYFLPISCIELFDDFLVIRIHLPTEQLNLTYFSAHFKESYQEFQKWDVQPTHVQPSVQKILNLGHSKWPDSENTQTAVVWIWGKKTDPLDLNSWTTLNSFWYNY